MVHEIARFFRFQGFGKDHYLPQAVIFATQKLINSIANFCVELEQTFDTFCELLINFSTIDQWIFEYHISEILEI